jgi:glycosyltransferase involved in cell wall biosynthesis
MPAPMKLSVIIPLYNEAEYFERLLAAVLAVKLPLEREIIIVESNSTDGSRELAKKYGKRPGIRVILQERPMGKGSAVRAGLAAAKGDVILIQDADMEYDPRDYPKLLQPILAGETKFVIGSRKMGHTTWQIRSMKANFLMALFINVIANIADAFFNLLYNVKLTDPQSMYKVFHRDCLKGVKLKSDLFNLDWEICAKFIRAGHVPLELPVHYASRDFSEGKKVKLFRDMFINTYAIVYYRFFD